MSREWIEITDPNGVNVAPKDRRYPPERLQYPYQAALALVGAGRAKWSSRPTPGDESDAEPEPTPEPNSTPEPEDGQNDPKAEPVPIEAVDFKTIRGVGKATADDIAEWLDEHDITTVEELLAVDATDLPGIADGMADEVTALLKSALEPQDE